MEAQDREDDEQPEAFLPLDDDDPEADVEVRRAKLVPGPDAEPGANEGRTLLRSHEAAAGLNDSRAAQNATPLPRDATPPPQGCDPSADPSADPSVVGARHAAPSLPPSASSPGRPSMVRPSAADAAPWLVVEGLRARRGGDEVLRGVDLSVGEGVTALIGAQGAGKTTLVRILLGIDSAGSGKATVIGRDARRDPLGIRRRVGYVPEDMAFTPGMTGLALNRLVESLYPGWKAQTFFELLARLGVPARRRVEDLLPGVRARLALAAALAFAPKALVVDVPRGLDASGRRDLLLGLAEERGSTPTLVATSEPRDVESLADSVIILAAGRRIYSGPKAALVSETRRIDLRPGAQRPTLPEGVRKTRWRPRSDGGRLWVHLARAGAHQALEELEGARAVHPVDFEEACLARIKGAEEAKA